MWTPARNDARYDRGCVWWIYYFTFVMSSLSQRWLYKFMTYSYRVNFTFDLWNYIDIEIYTHIYLSVRVQIQTNGDRHRNVSACVCVCVSEWMTVRVFLDRTNSRMLKELTCGEQQHSIDQCMQNEAAEQATINIYIYTKLFLLFLRKRDNNLNVLSVLNWIEI